jgi:hypothetical protein
VVSVDGGGGSGDAGDLANGGQGFVTEVADEQDEINVKLFDQGVIGRCPAVVNVTDRGNA